MAGAAGPTPCLEEAIQFCSEVAQLLLTAESKHHAPGGWSSTMQQCRAYGNIGTGWLKRANGMQGGGGDARG